MKKFKISYYYYATGMELGPDEFPEQIIIAQNKEMASYMYYLLYFDGYKKVTFNDFDKECESRKFWGLSINEVIE